MNVQNMVALRAQCKDYVPPTPYALGRRLYKLGRPVTNCRTADERRGWLDARGRTVRAFATGRIHPKAGIVIVPAWKEANHAG